MILPLVVQCLCGLVLVGGALSQYRDDISPNRLQLLEVERPPPRNAIFFPSPTPVPPALPPPQLPSHYENSKFQQMRFRAHSPFRNGATSKRPVKFPSEKEEDREEPYKEQRIGEIRLDEEHRPRSLEDEQIYRNALAAADILVPPFDGEANENSVEPNHQQQYTSAANRQRFTGSSRLESPDDSQQSQYFGGIQYAPNFSADLRRPAVLYGPALKYGPVRESNQFAYAPERRQRGRLDLPPQPIPFPPSFISITTSRPEVFHHQPPPPPPPPIGAGGNLPFDFPRVPDPFYERRAKSLLDSYIPSWEIAKMWQLQNGYPLDPRMPYRRYAKREVPLKKQKNVSAGGKGQAGKE